VYNVVLLEKIMSKESPFADLNPEFKSALESMTDENIMKRVSETAMAEHENRQAKTRDQDLAEKVATAKMAGEQYREATKMNKLKIAYAYFILESRGKV
jgi:hypothetical protein